MKSILFKTAMGLVVSAVFSSCALQADSANGSKKAEKGMPHAPCTKLVSKDAGRTKDKHGMVTYKDSERRRHVRTTSYSHMENEPGAPGKMNAAGTTLIFNNKVRSAAADWSVYPLGTKFRIKGLPYLYVVDDYGSSLAGTNTIDIYKPTLSMMRKWGSRNVEVTVVQWGSYERSRRLLSGRTGYWHCRKMHTAIVKKLSTGKYAKLEETTLF